jgi:hypothetical protein
MNLLAILAAPLLIAAISTAQAQEGRAVIGPTDFSCGKWINTPKRTLYHEQQKMWVLGYLSGINMGSPVDFLRATDVDGLTAWIDNYCHRNPLQGITQAISALTNELRSGR